MIKTFNKEFINLKQDFRIYSLFVISYMKTGQFSIHLIAFCAGKWTYEFLTLGEPITNDLGTKIIIEYLKSKTAAKGWVFIDYPNSYDQMSWLETTLMGTSPPPNPKELEIKDINVEDIEVIKPRIIFEDKSDPYIIQRLIIKETNSISFEKFTCLSNSMKFISSIFGTVSDIDMKFNTLTILCHLK